VTILEKCMAHLNEAKPIRALVRRLLDPHYASKLPRIAQAVAALGKRLVIGLESA
jgi:hypothetical protein